MKTIEVVAAIIMDHEKIFATQRGYGEFQEGWEFPGGKVEAGETKEEALVREIKEELQVDISIHQFFMTVEYDYPNFHLTMHCYLCKLLRGEFKLMEHKAARWLKREDLDSVSWLAADWKIIDKMKEVWPNLIGGERIC